MSLIADIVAISRAADEVADRELLEFLKAHSACTIDEAYNRAPPSVLVRWASLRGLSRDGHVRIAVAAARLVVSRLWYGRDVVLRALDAVEKHDGHGRIHGLRAALLDVRDRQQVNPHSICAGAERWSACMSCSAAGACLDALVASESQADWLRCFTASAVAWATCAAAATGGCGGSSGGERPREPLPTDAIRNVCEAHIPRAMFHNKPRPSDA